MNSKLLVLGLGAVSVFWAVSNWRLAIRAAMILLIVEGAIRKWVFPEAADLVYFGKDVLLLGAYVGYLGDERRHRLRMQPPGAITAVLVVAAGFGALQILNPALPSLLVGVFGFKVYFLYAPLLWVLPAAFDSDRDLARFLKPYLLAAIPIGLLAVVQFFSPRLSVINTYARGTDIFGFGVSTHARVTGTFSFISGYTAYLLATAIMLLAVLATTGWRLKRQLLIYAALALTLTGMLMTGSKGPVFMLVALLPIYYMLSVLRERGRGTTIRLVLALAILLTIVASTVPDAVSSWRARASGGTVDAAGRSQQIVTAPLHALRLSGALGYGIGSTHQASPALVGSPYAYWLPLAGFEAETGRVMIELGPLGFGLIYLLRFLIIGFAFRQVFLLRTTFHRSIATAAFLFSVAQLTGSPIFDPVANLYFWFSAGLVSTVVRLDRAFAPVVARANAFVVQPVAGRSPLQGAWTAPG